MDDLLVVYNICGIAKDNTENYVRYLESLVSQNFGKVVISACRPHARTLPYLFDKFGLDSVVVDDNLPVNVTFNYTVNKFVEKYGKFNAYAYVSCDSYCTQPNQLEHLYNTMVNHPSCGLICPRLLRDSGYAFGLKLGFNRFDDFGASIQMFSQGDYTIPTGRAVNAHTLFYSEKIRSFYGKCCPDIFKGFCTESVLSFVAGALGLNWLISREVVMGHDVNLDTPSAGQLVQEHAKTKPTWNHPLFGESLIEKFTNETALKLGLGYEECQNVVNHDPSQWDENFHCRNEELKQYIKDNLYLTKDELDYNLINGALFSLV